jgi:acid stress-induced BolA-like protein IbaG/YrbA
MDLELIKSNLVNELELDEAIIKSDGSHFNLTVVGRCFDGLSRVKQQQLVLKQLAEYIADGSMHAVSIKAFTPEAWEKDKKLQLLS